MVIQIFDREELILFIKVSFIFNNSWFIIGLEVLIINVFQTNLTEIICFFISIFFNSLKVLIIWFVASDIFT